MELVRNAWYVAALSRDVTIQPIKQIMLGEEVVLYRTEAGQAVALGDRCPHRFASLSCGKVRGDAIECPYHGLVFAPTGACVFNPHGDRKIPQAAKVRNYPVIESNGIVWAWVGDPQLADHSKLVDLDAFFGHGLQPLISGSYKVKANFGIVLDNLLDLSHAPFLHRGSLSNGEEDAAALSFEMRQDGNSVFAQHRLPSSKPSPQFASFWQSGSAVGDFRADMRWDPPCNLQLDVGITEVGRTAEEGLYMHMAHLLTPIDSTNTHYFWISSRNFVMDSAEVSAMLQANINLAFTTEDEPAMEAVGEFMGSRDLMALKPVLLAGDAAGLRARRILAQILAFQSSGAVSN